MAYHRYRFLNEVLRFNMPDFFQVVKSYQHTPVPFSIYTLLSGKSYYLHDERLNRLFFFQDEQGGPVDDASQMGNIILDYYLAYPENQLID